MPWSRNTPSASARAPGVSFRVKCKVVTEPSSGLLLLESGVVTAPWIFPWRIGAWSRVPSNAVQATACILGQSKFENGAASRTA